MTLNILDPLLRSLLEKALIKLYALVIGDGELDVRENANSLEHTKTVRKQAIISVISSMDGWMDGLQLF